MLKNPDAAEALADVDPSHWIVPWNELMNDRITHGRDLCGFAGFKALCHD